MPEGIRRGARLRAAALAAGVFALVGSSSAVAQEPGAEADVAAGAAGEATEDRFDVWEYRVLGSRSLPAAAVERAVYDHLGAGKTITDVEAARQALETAYRSAGYNTVFVDIPEQTVDRGVVRLNVTEGKLDRVRITGARHFSNRKILSELPALAQGTVPYFPEVQEQLAALNRQTADRTITPVLRAGRYPGTVDMELKVDDDLPFHGSFEVNDRYTADTSELRSSVNLSYDNLWQRGHTASLQYQAAPEQRDEAEVLALTYVARLERAKSILALYAVDSSSDVATVGTLSVLGSGNIFGVRGIRPLDSIDSFFHSATVGIDFKDFDENIRLTEATGLATAIKYVAWSANYGFGWRLPASLSEFSVGAAWGIRGFGNDDAEFEAKRFRGRGNFGYLLGTASHSRSVFGNARFVARAAWQYANSPLISNEQFTAGGVASVRGYLEAERLGDLGASLSLELHSPSLVSGPRVDELRLFGFYDAASLRLEDPLPEQDDTHRLESAGLGLRFTGLSGLTVELDWARALRDGANVARDDERTHFQVRYGF